MRTVTYILLLMLSACGSSGSGSDNNSGKDSSAQKDDFPLEFLSDSIDLGMVYSDDEYPFFFKFTNNSGGEISLPLEVNHSGKFEDIVHPGEDLMKCGLLNFVYQFSEAVKGESTEMIKIKIGEKTKNLKVHFNYAGDASSRPKTISNDIYPAFFFSPAEDGKFRAKILIPNKGKEKLHIRDIVIEDKDVVPFLNTQKFCGEWYNTRYIEPGEEGLLEIEADQAVLDKAKGFMQEFKVQIECNTDIPPIRVRYQLMPG